MKKDSSVTKFPKCNYLEFFNYWLRFTEPIHKLANKEIEVFSLILLKRFQLSKIIIDNTLLDEYVLSNNIRDEICKTVGIKTQNYRVIFSSLKKKGVITEDNKINPHIIPRIKQDTEEFNLIFIFDIEDDTKQGPSENT